MLDAEMKAWARTACPQTIITINAAASAVQSDWASRLRGDVFELVSLMPYGSEGNVDPRAAQLASIELAIICDIWPKPLDDVLRGGGHLALRPI
jgi:hypothetical protein